MQQFDQEKLTEFTHELSEFQTEAGKTASVEIYDRFTISKLEDHIVDLYQLAIDSAHEGLQYLCECMRDNVRDHFITGTNISDEEIALMGEWKSLVKAYLINNDNHNVVKALVSNLSKPGWVYPLSPEDQVYAMSTLLGNSSGENSLAGDAVTDIDEGRVNTDFDAYMKESSESLADVFQSTSESSQEENNIVGLGSILEDDEPSLAECFEDHISPDNEASDSQNDAINNDIHIDRNEKSIEDEEPAIEKALSEHNNIEKVVVSEEELSQIKQPPEAEQNTHEFVDEELDAKDLSDEDQVQIDFVKSEFKQSHDIEKVEVSSEELEQINESIDGSPQDEFDNQDSDENVDNLNDDLSVSEAVNAIDDNIQQDTITVSDAELAAIDASVKDEVAENIVNELFVDESGNDIESDSYDMGDELSALDSETDYSDQASANVEVSAEELSVIDQNIDHLTGESSEVPQDLVEESAVEYEDISLDGKPEPVAQSNNQPNIEESQELSEITQSTQNSIENNSIVEDSVPNQDHTRTREGVSKSDAFKALFARTAEESIEANSVEIDELEQPNKEDNVDRQSDRDDNTQDHSEELIAIEETTDSVDDSVAESYQHHDDEVTPVMRALENGLYIGKTSSNSHQTIAERKDDEVIDLSADANEPDAETFESPINHQLESDREMTIAEEAIFGSHSEAVDNDSGFVDTSIEEILPIEDTNSVSQEMDLDANNELPQAPIEPVQTVYIEPSTSVQEEEPKSRSIIEAYVDAISTQSPRKKPNELEQELIETPVVVAETVKLEPIDSILLKYSDWNDEQKELLSLILTEAQDAIDQQADVLSVLHASPLQEEAILDMVTLYSEQLERLGSAAEMVGLDALQKLCELIGFHFGDLARASVDMIVNSEELIKQWPLIIYNYLRNIYNETSHQEAIEYISNDNWARTIREDIKIELKQAFSQSSIQIEHDENDQRITTANSSHVDITVPDDVQAELLDGLLQELPHQTEEFSSSIQKLVDDDFLHQLEVSQRIAHTIKGAANTVGIVGVATLTHQLEDILQALLKAQSKPNVDLHTALVDASDCLEQMTEYLLDRGEQPEDAVQTLQVILDWANYIDEFGPPSIEAESISVAVKTSQDNNQVAEHQEKTKPAQEASLRVPANMIDDLINQSGESIIASSQMHENVTRLIHSLRDIRKNREDVYTLSQTLEHMIDVQGAQNNFSMNETNEKFDPLELDKYNELHTYSRRLIEATADSVELVKDLEQRLYSLESVIADQSRVQKDNQYAILKARMAPIESIIPRLKRGVRQSAKISQKQVELEVLGADTLLDSKILNNLIDPLMHLLRNAVDHGVESDEIRQEQGKSLPAIITLTFEQIGERLEIKCIDDGRGLDTDKIRALAIERELITEQQPLSEQELHQIILQHGFSTRDEVTQLSGRGVGMDVVYSNIKELNGAVQIHSEQNKGMTAEISLPVSLLSAHALLIPTREGTLAVSTSGIEEILQVSSDDLKETDKGLSLNTEQGAYAAVYLEQLLKTPLASLDADEKMSALLIENISGEKKVILVSEIRNVSDIIIKPFSHYLPKVDGLIGATVLANGDVAAVVDVSELISQQLELVGRLRKEVATDLEMIHQLSVLVVEDSISTRRSLAEFMQDLNYKVFTAKDGVEAVEIMRQHVPNIVLTDLEMPRMNGLELTSHIRSHDETKHIPVIMLTSRTTEKHKQEALSLGVNEYLSKPFVEDILLEKVQHLVAEK